MAHSYSEGYLFDSSVPASTVDKLITLAKSRWDGSKTVKCYSPPATPCDRLLREDSVGERVREELNEYRAGLDPVELLRSTREAQFALAAMSSPAPRTR